MLFNWKTLMALGILGSLAASEASAQWGPYGRGLFGPRMRGPRGVVYAAPVVTPYPYVVNETRYVYTSPTVITREIIQLAPVVERRVVQPPPVVEERVVQPPPIEEQRVIQPPPIEEQRVIQPPAVVQDRIVRPSNLPPPLPVPY